jgi:hypothetical protein
MLIYQTQAAGVPVQFRPVPDYPILETDPPLLLETPLRSLLYAIAFNLCRHDEGRRGVARYNAGDTEATDKNIDAFAMTFEHIPKVIGVDNGKRTSTHD